MGVTRKVKRNASAEVVTIGQAFSEFIEQSGSRGLAASTLRNYRQSYEYFMDFHELEETAPISSINVSMFYKWMGSMQLDGISPAAINHYLRDCRRFFYWCMDESRKYLGAFKVEMVKAQEEAPKMFSDEDIDKLLAKPSVNGDDFGVWRTWAIVNWVLATGNRAATICDVCIGDIDFKNREISLRHTKNKKAQSIPLSTALASVLKEYIRVWRSDAIAEDWLFSNVGNEQLTTNALRKAFTRYCNDRGVEQTNIHGLRHTFARDWIRNGGSAFELQKLLGHSTLDMTKRYVKLSVDDMKEHYSAYSPLDRKKSASSRVRGVKRSK